MELGQTALPVTVADIPPGSRGILTRKTGECGSETECIIAAYPSVPGGGKLVMAGPGIVGD
jgi:hypothetical protein